MWRRSNQKLRMGPGKPHFDKLSYVCLTVSKLFKARHTFENQKMIMKKTFSRLIGL